MSIWGKFVSCSILSAYGGWFDGEAYACLKVTFDDGCLSLGKTMYNLYHRYVLYVHIYSHSLYIAQSYLRISAPPHSNPRARIVVSNSVR